MKMVKNRNRMPVRAAAVLLTFIVTLTTVTFVSGSLDVSAKSPYWKKIKVKTTDSSTVVVSWAALSKKQRNKISGIAIYRNGKVYKRLGKKAKFFTDTGLKAGTKYTYQVKTYKKTRRKIKMWENKITGAVRKKAPSNKEKKQYKKITVKKTSYKYGNASAKMTVKTARMGKATDASSNYNDWGNSSVDCDGGSGGSGSSSSTDEQAAQWIAEDTAEDVTTYIEFNGVRVHKGQTWSTSLYNQLASGANGTWSCGHNKLYHRYPAAIYLFNTNTYKPFMAIVTANNKVVGFHSNAETLFTYKGQQILRNQDKDYYGSGIRKFYAGPSRGVLMAGTTTITGADRSEDHRTLGVHFINAARIAAGVGILERSRYLEGVDKNGNNMTWTGTIPEGYYNAGIYVTNGRYGAQAWAETMAASHYTGHSTSGFKAGPLYNVDYSDEDIAEIDCEEDIGRTPSTSVSCNGENVGGGSGEWMVYHYSNSSIHYGTLLNSDFISVGVGWCDGYHAERFSRRQSEGW